MARRENTMDMCRGPLLRQVIRYAVPLVLTYVLQLLFHAADLIVIGQFASYQSMGAIGATSTIIGVQLNFFLGATIGANVVVAQFFGAKDSVNVKRSIHTTMGLMVICGILLMLCGFSLGGWLLEVTDVPADIIGRSKIYLMINFAGIPFLMLYNGGCAVLRALGDTKRPLFYLTIAGVANVLLNLLLVTVFKFDVAGVALATIVSHAISAYLVVQAMRKTSGPGRLIIRRIRIDAGLTKKILMIGIPAGVQSACFAFSNMLIQSGINFFGAAAVAGMTAGITLESLLYSIVFGMHQTAIAFVGQNYGGKRYYRLKKSVRICLMCACAAVIVIGMLMLLFGRELLGMFTSDSEVIDWGMLRMKILFANYFLLVFMDVSSGELRGLGYSLRAALASLFGACVLRVMWLKFIFRTMEEPSMAVLLWSYPVSWLIVSIINFVMIYCILKKLLPRSDGKNILYVF